MLGNLIYLHLSLWMHVPEIGIEEGNVWPFTYLRSKAKICIFLAAVNGITNTSNRSGKTDLNKLARMQYSEESGFASQNMSQLSLINLKIKNKPKKAKCCLEPQVPYQRHLYLLERKCI